MVRGLSSVPQDERPEQLGMFSLETSEGRDYCLQISHEGSNHVK